MKEIIMGSYVVLVDDEDYQKVGHHIWRPQVHKRGKVYAQSPIGSMHRYIMGAKKGEIVDHINGSGLDNRRSNLRLVTAGQNRYNSRPEKTRVGCPYKGVSYYAANRKWGVQIVVNGRKHWGGLHECPVAAALTFDRLAIELQGPHAWLNFPRASD
jgi:hypothetical protein